MATLEDKQIETNLKDIENKIKDRKSITREDIQNALDKLKNQKINPDRKKEIITNLITRTFVKVKGIKNYFASDEDLSMVDKTYEFLNDLNSYSGFIEKEK